jgi:DNA-binding beta-propeller fold protein YncE
MRSAPGVAIAIVAASIGLTTTGASAESRAAVTPRPVTVWATSQDDGTVTPIDAATNVAGTPINLSNGANTAYQIAATPDGSAVYVTMFGDNAVRRVDTATGEAGPEILLGDDRGANPIGIAITPNGKTAYVSDYSYVGNGAVYPIDLATGTVGTTIEPQQELGAIAITPNGRTAWVAELSFPDQIAPISVKTGKVGTPIVLGGQYPQSIGITPDGSTAYVVDFNPGDPSLVEVDLATRTVTRRIPTSGSIAINPQGTLMYLGGDGVVPVDLPSGTVGTAIAPGREGLVQVAFTPDGTAAFATMYRHKFGRVVAFDVTHSRLLGSNPIGAEATGITITPDQAPIAAFVAHRAAAGSATQFDASASQAVSSPIVNYHWDFGDGTTSDTSTATTGHVYADPDTYTVVLTLTDAAGTSTERVSTGQYVSRNGSRLARRTHTVTID